MNLRSTIASTVMIVIFSLFLFWLYSIGKITAEGIGLLVLGGVLFLAIVHFVYRKMYSEED
jgi:hypothetical protein